MLTVEYGILSLRNDANREKIMDWKHQDRQTLEGIAQQVGKLLERLNEQQRRHVLGLLAHVLGRGGDSFLAEQYDVDRRTIRKGKRELLDGFEGVPANRLRKPGGGRPTLEKKDRKSGKPSKKSSRPTSEACRPDAENGCD